MVLQKQIQLSNYYVKKNGNTANKNIVTNASGVVDFEEKNNHQHTVNDITNLVIPTVDNTITQNGNNPVNSGAIYSALQTKQNAFSQLYSVADANGVPIFYDDDSFFYGINSRIYHDMADTNELHFLNSNDEDINFDDLATTDDLFSGSYNDLTNKPTLTTLSGNGTLQISDIQGLGEQLDAQFKIQVIQEYDTDDLRDDYGDINGECFGQYIADENISYDGSTIYFLQDSSTGSSFYNEYVLVDDTGLYPVFELLGTTQVDLSDYATITYVQSNYATTQALNNKIASSITNGDTTHAPSGDAVFDALALKMNTADFATQLESVVDSLINEANQS